MDWKNQWTQEKAFNHCQQAFVATTSFAVCSDNVPSVPSDNFINDCVLDIQVSVSCYAMTLQHFTLKE